MENQQTAGGTGGMVVGVGACFLRRNFVIILRMKNRLTMMNTSAPIAARMGRNTAMMVPMMDKIFSNVLIIGLAAPAVPAELRVRAVVVPICTDPAAPEPPMILTLHCSHSGMSPNNPKETMPPAKMAPGTAMESNRLSNKGI